jgi:pyridoxamine 5'-phosphate oxidase
VFFWAPLERQIRVDGAVERVPAADSDAYFATRPAGARLSACASAQSGIVPGRSFLESEVEKIKGKYGANPPRPAHWGGYRVVPGRMEFWQGRENRLHDRLLYTRDTGGWKIERLAP